MSKPMLAEHDVIIANGESLSATLDLDGGVLEGFVMPAAWTAATVSFEGSMDDVTYYECGDGTAEVSLVADTGWLISIGAGTINGLGRYVRVRSGTSAIPVNQGAARTITLLVRV